MITIDPAKPNRLATCAYDRMNERPLIGNFTLGTEQGDLPVLVNKAAAAMLISALAHFLASDGNEPEIAANDDLPY